MRQAQCLPLCPGLSLVTGVQSAHSAGWMGKEAVSTHLSGPSLLEPSWSPWGRIIIPTTDEAQRKGDQAKITWPSMGSNQVSAWASAHPPAQPSEVKFIILAYDHLQTTLEPRAYLPFLHIPYHRHHLCLPSRKTFCLLALRGGKDRWTNSTEVHSLSWLPQYLFCSSAVTWAWGDISRLVLLWGGSGADFLLHFLLQTPTNLWFWPKPGPVLEEFTVYRSDRCRQRQWQPEPSGLQSWGSVKAKEAQKWRWGTFWKAFWKRWHWTEDKMEKEVQEEEKGWARS